MPSVYKEATYHEITRWQAETAIEYVPNGKRAGTKSSERYDAYAVSKTVADAIRLGSKPEDLLNDFEKGLLKRIGGPVRDAPLDLMAIEDAEDLTEVDLILARWGYHEGREEHGGRGEWFKNNKDKEDPGVSKQFKGMSPEELEAWKSKMSEQYKKLRKVVLAKKVGVRPQDLKETSNWAESSEMIAERTKANVEAAKILEAVRAEGRKVSDEEVLKVLRLWTFKKNADRPNVTPAGEEYVLSDTLGLLRARDGRYMATLPTRNYTQVMQLLCQSLKDNRPEGIEIDWPFTSISVNSSYAAKRHRDQNNLGPSAIRAFGNFSGGRLGYWPDDNRSIKNVEDLNDSDKVMLDAREKTCVFDGCRCHTVEPYEGEERFSLVFFIADGYTKTPEDVQETLKEAGINFPTAESVECITNLLPAPKGYGGPAPVQKPKASAATPKPGPMARSLSLRAGKPGTGTMPGTPKGGAVSDKGDLSCFFRAKASTPVRKRPRMGARSSEPASSEKLSEKRAHSHELASSEKRSEKQAKVESQATAGRGGASKTPAVSEQPPVQPSDEVSLAWKNQLQRLIALRKQAAEEQLNPPVKRAMEEEVSAAPRAKKGKKAKQDQQQGTTPSEEVQPAKSKEVPKQQVATASEEVQHAKSKEVPKQQVATPSEEVQHAKSEEVPKQQVATPSEEAQQAKSEEVPNQQVATPSEEATPSQEAQQAKSEEVPSRGECNDNEQDEFRSLAMIFDAFELTAATDKDVVQALADYFLSLRRAAGEPEQSLSAAFNLLVHSTPVPESTLMGAVVEAFGQGDSGCSSSSDLPSIALERRRASSCEASVLTLQDVAEVLKLNCHETHSGEEGASSALVGKLAQLLKASRVEGKETRFLVQILQGSHRVSQDILHESIARALVSWIV